MQQATNTLDIDMIAHLASFDRAIFELLAQRWRAPNGRALQLARDKSTLEAFERYLEFHGLIGILLKYHAPAVQATLGPAFLVSLRVRYLGAIRNRQAQLEILRLVEAQLGAAGIQWCVLKGPALSIQLYGDPNLRSSIDLDILIAPEALEGAIDLLLANGFVLAANLPPPNSIARALYRRVTHQLPLLAANGVCVEIHWRSDFSPQQSVDSALLLSLTPNCVHWDDVDIPTVPAEQLLSIVARHAYRSLWVRWKWLYDSVECANRFPKTARELTGRGEVSVVATLALAELLMGLPADTLLPAAARQPLDCEVMLAYRADKISSRPDRPTIGMPGGRSLIHNAKRLLFLADASPSLSGKVSYILWRAERLLTNSCFLRAYGLG